MRFTCLDVAKATLGQSTKQSGHELHFRCPVHDDHNPSLAVNQKKDVWMCGPCNRGGTPWELAAFLAGFDPSDKSSVMTWLQDHGLLEAKAEGREFVCGYVYEDESRKSLYRVERYRVPPPKNKTFTLSRPDGNGGWTPGVEGIRRVPYRLPDFINQDTVYIAEGEADVDELWNWSLPSTTNRTGAGKWKSEYNQYFEGKRVVLLPDQDPVGESHMEDVARHLFPVAKAIKIVSLPGLPERGDSGIGKRLVEPLNN